MSNLALRELYERATARIAELESSLPALLEDAKRLDRLFEHGLMTRVAFGLNDEGQMWEHWDHAKSRGEIDAALNSPRPATAKASFPNLKIDSPHSLEQPNP